MNKLYYIFWIKYEWFFPMHNYFHNYANAMWMLTETRNIINHKSSTLHEEHPGQTTRTNEAMSRENTLRVRMSYCICKNRWFTSIFKLFSSLKDTVHPKMKIRSSFQNQMLFFCLLHKSYRFVNDDRSFMQLTTSLISGSFCIDIFLFALLWIAYVL